MPPEFMPTHSKTDGSQSASHHVIYRRNAVIILGLLSVISVVALSLWKIHSFPSHPWYRTLPAFVTRLFAIAAGIGTFTTVSLKVVALIRHLVTKKKLKISFRDIGRVARTQFARIATNRPLFATSTLILSLLAVLLVVLLIRIPRSDQIRYLLNPKLDDPGKPAGLALSPDNTEIYVADEEAKKLVVFARSPLKKRHTISLPNKPWSVAVSPDGREIWISSIDSGAVMVLSHDTYQVISSLQTGEKPHWIAITPDGKKAYISNEGPVPNGNISVIDAVKHRVVRSIDRVNCPEGLDIAKDTKLLYVATQCGWQHDPVFVIDTIKDEVLREQTVLDMAVGGAIAVTPDGTKAYVARSNFRWPGPFPWWDFRRQDRTPLGIIDLERVGKPKAKIPLILRTSVSCIAVTRDGKYVLVGNSNEVTIINTETDKVVNRVSLPAAANAIVVGPDDWVYVTVPQEGQLFAFSLKGLV
jgi:DNA-binding beta-propeller fold protein YncE